ncbi:MAG TPA: hypothetical protein PKD79_01790 [Candidatus Doudnabacteria bacterium]|nr:hypothetical protein [Candidatus Doudnabacteria bacterium]
MGFLGEMFGGGKEAHQDWKAESGEGNESEKSELTQQAEAKLAEYKSENGSDITKEASSDLKQMKAQQQVHEELLKTLE